MKNKMEIEKKIAWFKISFMFFGIIWITLGCLVLLLEVDYIIYYIIRDSFFIVTYIMYIILLGCFEVIKELKKERTKNANRS